MPPPTLRSGSSTILRGPTVERRDAKFSMSDDSQVYGVQPVLQVIRGSTPVQRVLIARAEGGQTQRIRELARKRGLKIQEVSREELDRRLPGARHQGVLALLDKSEVLAVPLTSVLEAAHAANEAPLILLLDGIQDPHNLGAIVRSAYCLGAHAVVIEKNRAAPVSAAAVRASAGAALHLPLVRVTNLKHALDELEANDVWTAAAVMNGVPAAQVRLDGPVALVIGGEAKGVRPTVAKRCDLQVSIEVSHGFDSLNASVAAGILLYEIGRQRRARAQAAGVEHPP